MIKKNLVLLFSSMILSIGCSEEDKNDSATLRISWDKLPEYSYYLFTSPIDTSVTNRSFNHQPNEGSSLDYTWDGKDINLFSVAIEEWAVEDYNIYPESDGQGHLYLKRNNQIISFENQDLLIASPQQIVCGKASTYLPFHYGMSLIKVVLELDGIDGYTFDIQMKAIKSGYIDIQSGKVIPEGTPGNIYLSQNDTQIKEYGTVIIPQQLTENTVLSITGIKSLGEKILRIDYRITPLTLENSKQYIWNFNVSGSGITYKSFNKSSRPLNK